MTFTARYGGRCPGCGTKIRVGDECDYDDSVVVHYGCAATAFDPTFDDRVSNRRHSDDNHEPLFTVTGRRNHARRCGDCNLTHAGDCW